MTFTKTHKLAAATGVAGTLTVAGIGGAVATATSAPSATTAAAGRAIDGDADLIGARTVRLEAETRGANRVTFIYDGKRVRGSLTDVDREDGTREWARNLTAMRSDRQAGATVTFKVRACGGDGCATRSFSERVEFDD